MMAAIGVAPRNAAAYDDELDRALREAAARKDVCAIGSCGLAADADETQLHAFKRQIALARDFNLPLVVEAPGAYDRAYNVLEHQGFPQAGVLVRAFDGSAEELIPWVARGCYISFDIRTADDPTTFCNLAEKVPQDRIVVESGAPERATELLHGYPARADQSTFAALALTSICPSAQLAQNTHRLFSA